MHPFSNPANGRQRCLTLLVFLALLAVIATQAFRQPLSFDAGYNFLSYRNVVDAGFYGHLYGGDRVPFDPRVTTGPTVNIPLLLISLLTGSVLAGASIVVVCYWALLLALMWRAWNDRRPALGLLLFAVLLPTLLYDGTVLQNMFSLLGEIYTAIFVFAFALFVWDSKREKARLWPFAFLGLALATKHTHIVGMAPTLLFVAVLIVRDPTISPDPSGRGRSVFAAKALGLTLGPPMLLAMLPRLLLWGDDYELHRAAVKWYNDIATLALGNLYSLVGYLGGKNPNGLAEIKLNLLGKLGAIVQFKHGVFPLVTWVSLNLILTVWLMRRRRNMGLACMMLYGAGLFAWWFFLSRLDWHRYFFSADIALVLALSASVPSLLEQFRSGAPSKRRAVLACTLVACAYVLGTFSALNWRGQWINLAFTARSRSAQARVAQLVSQGKRDDAAFFGIEWFQAPDIQALTGNYFFDIRKPRHVQLALRSKGKLYLVVTPETFLVGRAAQDTLVQFGSSTVFEDFGYGLYELSRPRLEQVATLHQSDERQRRLSRGQ